MKTRNGKIARLPRRVRDELNARLDNGEPGGPLLDWLNSLPATLAVLTEHFAGQPINPQNLSDWRQGGFKDWQRREETMELAESFFAEVEDLEEEPGGVPFSDRLAPLLTLTIARLLRAATEAEAGPEQHRLVIELAREFTQIRRTDHEEERMQRDHERWEAEKEAIEKAELAAQEKEIEKIEAGVDAKFAIRRFELEFAEQAQREHLAKGEPVPADVAAVIANRAKLEEQMRDWQNRPKWRGCERVGQGQSSPIKVNQAMGGETGEVAREPRESTRMPKYTEILTTNFH